jgi:hypothetical protein
LEVGTAKVILEAGKGAVKETPMSAYWDVLVRANSVEDVAETIDLPLEKVHSLLSL